MKNFIRSNIAYIIPVIIVIVFLIFVSSMYIMPSSENVEKRSIYINVEEFSVEIAETAQERSRGLQFHEPLKENEGMLFVFQREGRHGFWMPNMAFSLDMIWISSDFKIIHIEKDVPPCESMPCVSYKPENPALYVLEINSGRSSEMKIGDSVDLSNAIA